MLDKLRGQLMHRGARFLKVPLRLTPFIIQRQLLAQLLTWQFHQSLIEGELAFLTQRGSQIEVRDLAMKWYITVKQGQLQVSQQPQADVILSADTHDFILMAAGKEDPDTLFFQRRLRIEGDIELGLQVKNLMDTMGLKAMPQRLRFGLLQLAEFIAEGLQEGMASDSRTVSSC